jgi:protein O-GlcNAc transferase
MIKNMWTILDLFPEEFLIHILDIGAALSEVPAYKAIVDSGKGKIIGFEPDLAECEKLNQTYGSPHQFFPYFVGDGKPATFYETTWNLTGSLFEPNAPLLEKFHNLAELVTLVKTHPVETKTIDAMPEITTVDLIKIDVQGAELMIFENATRILPQTLVIQTEVEFVELYKNQPLFADIDRLLRSYGFQFHKFLGFGSRTFKPLMLENPYQGHQFLWSDAIYVRDWMKLEELSLLQLKKYAILAHEVVRSPDLVHLILSTIDAKAGTNYVAMYEDRLFNR